MELSRPIAIILEGAAEEAIMDILLDNDCLCFTRSDLLERTFFRDRSASSFEQRHLKFSFGEEKVTICRILDSRKENFRLSKQYKDKVGSIHQIITAPEIEILIVIAEGAYEDYASKWRVGKRRPSEYCKTKLRMPNVKKYDFITEYFIDHRKLVDAIKEYKRIHSPRSNDELSLYDLLKDELK